MSPRQLFVAIVLALLVAEASAAPAHAAFPGENGLIAYATGGDEEHFEPGVIRTVKPNGTRSRALIRADRRFPGGAWNPDWSRDGRKLLFIGHPGFAHTTARFSLRYADHRGKRIRRIPLGFRRRVGSLVDAAWAPSGRRVVFSAAGRLYTISIDGTRRRSLHQRGRDLSWSSDGRYIVFAGRTGIFAIRPNGTRLKRLSVATTAYGHSGPSVSPDGQRVTYLRQSGDGAPTAAWHMVDIDGRRSTVVREHPNTSGYEYGPLFWAPNGSRLAALRQGSGGSPTETFGSGSVITVSPAGTDERVAFGLRFTHPYYEGFESSFSWQPRN